MQLGPVRVFSKMSSASATSPTAMSLSATNLASVGVGSVRSAPSKTAWRAVTVVFALASARWGRSAGPALRDSVGDVWCDAGRRLSDFVISFVILFHFCFVVLFPFFSVFYFYLIFHLLWHLSPNHILKPFLLTSRSFTYLFNSFLQVLLASRPFSSHLDGLFEAKRTALSSKRDCLSLRLGRFPFPDQTSDGTLSQRVP